MFAAFKGKVVPALVTAATAVTLLLGSVNAAESVQFPRLEAGTAQGYNFELKVPDRSQGEDVKVIGIRSVRANDYNGSYAYVWKVTWAQGAQVRLQIDVDGRIIDGVWEGRADAHDRMKLRACLNGECGQWNGSLD